MTNTTTTTPTTDWRQDIKRRIIAGIADTVRALQETAAIYMEAITKDPGFRDWIAEEVPEVSGYTWRSLEMVGRGQLDARIVAGCPYGNKLRRLPMSEQQRAIDGTLPLLTATGDTLQVRLDALLPSQADQIFAAGHVRSLAEQKAWMEAKASQIAMTKPANRGPQIEINRKKRCIVVNGVTLSAADLADYLRKISE